MKKMLIAGGTGMIGNVLRRKAIEQGWDVHVLSRSAGEGRVVWDPAAGRIDLAADTAFDAIVNLAGEPIAGSRWTPARKRLIIQSRLDAAQTLYRYLSDGRLTTKVYIGASGIGIYGDRGDQRVTEATSAGPAGDWMADIGRQWEAAHLAMEDLGIRTVVTRIGIVLSTHGGALKEMLMTAPFGFLTTFGTGKAYMAWIHIRDLAGVMLWAADSPATRGVYLACAPDEVTNGLLVRTAAVSGRYRRLVLPVPRFALAIALGEMHRVLFDSCRGYPARLLAEGFSFTFREIAPALRDLLGRQPGEIGKS